MRIAIGGLAHEANSFCPVMAKLDDFGDRRLARGEKMLDGWQTLRTEEAGALGVLLRDAEVTVTPTLLARALSSQCVEGATYRALTDELLQRIEAALPLDGVLLVLHGAMVADGEPDATGALLARVRQLLGPDVPVVGTLDLHANVTRQMAREATALIGYQTAPHVDMYEAGQRAAQVLVATIRGQITPTMALERLPMLLPPEHSTHNYGPLAQVIERVHELERQGRIVHGGVYPVQPWMDIPDVASSIVVITDGEQEAAEALAQELAGQFWSLRQKFVIELVPPDAAVARALAHQSGMVVLCDSADATSSGSTGDSTDILRAAMRALPFEDLALLNIVDAQTVAQAIAAGVGHEVTVEVGGKESPQYFAPVTFCGRVKTISEGVFAFQGPGMKGVLHHMGRAVVLVQGGIHLLVMEHGISQWDPEMYRCVGLAPERARLVQVKSPMAFRAAYEGLYDEVIVVEARGAASPQLRRLPWRQVGRPIYPLDQETTWP